MKSNLLGIFAIPSTHTNTQKGERERKRKGGGERMRPVENMKKVNLLFTVSRMAEL